MYIYIYELRTKLLVWGKSPNVKGPLSVLQVLNMDYGVSVLGGPLSVMKVPCAASKFKATSYYSVHPLILSAIHIYIYTHKYIYTVYTVYLFTVAWVKLT